MNAVSHLAERKRDGSASFPTLLFFIGQQLRQIIQPIAVRDAGASLV